MHRRPQAGSCSSGSFAEGSSTGENGSLPRPRSSRRAEGGPRRALLPALSLSWSRSRSQTVEPESSPGRRRGFWRSEPVSGRTAALHKTGGLPSPGLTSPGSQRVQKSKGPWTRRECEEGSLTREVAGGGAGGWPGPSAMTSQVSRHRHPQRRRSGSPRLGSGMGLTTPRRCFSTHRELFHLPVLDSGPPSLQE